jgi:hypothetical protein
MREVDVTLPELALLVGTRAALAVGAGLLTARFLPIKERQAIGWTLVFVGVATTVPLAFEIFGKVRPRAATWVP